LYQKRREGGRKKKKHGNGEGGMKTTGGAEMGENLNRLEKGDWGGKKLHLKGKKAEVEKKEKKKTTGRGGC